MAIAVTGVATADDWSLKARWSIGRQAWLVQAEHRMPERGGWIRGWLATEAGAPAEFNLLTDALVAIERFLDAPTWARCREFSGV
ncbi:hypothetical protein [Sulfobacillus harzensis]|uniref:Uncharacterized protein n=1 Tax=Sulfobacillus harzensis TaxID=2729629 RepID=A0A7Y0Q4D6_9FIRM|nr:hypothetical protein [Sulfobacillus harzensis]NMP24512.1 hypothetical protein [Sulfobacillus harzensis]